MARTKRGFSAAVAVLAPCFTGIPAAAGALPSAVSISAAGHGVMVERRVGSRKLIMPAVLIGHENAPMVFIFNLDKVSLKKLFPIPSWVPDRKSVV